MGVVDLLVSLWGNIRLVVTSLLEQHHAFSKVLERIQTPAIPPSPNPTSSAWQEPPHPFPDVRLPDTIVDVLIIGSGITGASVAHELLSSENSKDWRVVMADSRGVCSGATVCPAIASTPMGLINKDAGKERWTYQICTL
jgi:hypothetical protein